MSVIYALFKLLLFLLPIPLMGVIAAVSAIFSGFPVLFRQKRIGKNGIPFEIYKFRTMRVDSEVKKKQLLKKNEADGPVFKIHDDPRFTRIGRFLAHTGLDELPQLYNVLRGDMALIGPRPLPIEEAKLLKPWQKKRELVLPGIISPWIVNGYHTQTFDAWMKSDIDYMKQKSFQYDISLCFRVFITMIGLFIKECARSAK